ncbi:putative BTB/POZ domain-containing protein [Iris pallida]|uniref:BTB/POZ domain-containing protein n=1 Tax=Iris pallida TaxID=29817 RepID=A0AAX6HZ53_IRIPA|nr:putative BTB/POZ domain-containing protein [Iris pallida]
MKLNVGGRLFETTESTLGSGGPDSLLAALSQAHHRHENEEEEEEEEEEEHVIFIDRDPDVFSVLLSLLRSGRLPSAASRQFSKQDLLEESVYYGIEPILRSAMSPPPLLGIDASLSTTILPKADPFPTALSADAPDGSLWLAHGGQISSYDSNLTYLSTVRTHLDDVTSLRRLFPSSDVSAVGSLRSPGLHFYDVSSGRHVGSAHWSDPSDPRVYKAKVTAIAAHPPDPPSSHPLFASFECPHWENTILSLDRATLQIVSEIGRQNGSSSKLAAPGKLVHVAEKGLVFASAVSSGSFGYAGYMRLWDPRSSRGAAVWETCEPGGVGSSSRFGDSFADADVDTEELAIYKVCWNSGDVAVADMRMLGQGRDHDPWFYLEDKGTGLRSAGRGQDSVLHCYKKQVFVSRHSGLEVCSSPVEEEPEGEEESSYGEGEGTISRSKGRTYMRNFVDKEEDTKRGMIRKMEGGGDRLFVSRDGMEGVEVWESSHLSGAISLLY